MVLYCDHCHKPGAKVNRPEEKPLCLKCSSIKEDQEKELKVKPEIKCTLKIPDLESKKAERMARNHLKEVTETAINGEITFGILVGYFWNLKNMCGDAVESFSIKQR